MLMIHHISISSCKSYIFWDLGITTYPHKHVNLDEVDGGPVDEGPGLIQLVDPIVILKWVLSNCTPEISASNNTGFNNPYFELYIQNQIFNVTSFQFWSDLKLEKTFHL